MKVSVDSGAAEHVMLEGMFQRVKLERKTSPKRFVVANGGRIRGTSLRSAGVVKLLLSLQKVVRTGNIVVLDEKTPQIRNARDRTVIKLDVNSGV